MDKHKIMGLNKRIVAKVGRLKVELIVVSYAIIMAVHGQSSGLRDLADVSWGQWVTMQCLWPVKAVGYRCQMQWYGA